MLLEILLLAWNRCRSGLFCCVLNTVFRNWCLNMLSTCTVNEICAALPHPIQLVFQRSADVPSLPAHSSLLFVPFLGRRDSFSFKCSLWVPTGLAWAAVYYLCIRKGRKASKGQIPGAGGMREQRPRRRGCGALGWRLPAVQRELHRERGSGKGRVKTRWELQMDFILQSERGASVPVAQVNRCLCEMLKPLWGEEGMTTAVMVIYMWVIHVVEHRCVLQVFYSFACVLKSALCFSAELFLKWVKPFLCGSIKQSIMFSFSFPVLSQFACLAVLFLPPFSHESSYAACEYYDLIQAVEMWESELCKVPSNWKQTPLSLFLNVLESHFQKWFRITLKLFL